MFTPRIYVVCGIVHVVSLHWDHLCAFNHWVNRIICNESYSNKLADIYGSHEVNFLVCFIIEMCHWDWNCWIHFHIYLVFHKIVKKKQIYTFFFQLINYKCFLIFIHLMGMTKRDIYLTRIFSNKGTITFYIY